MYVTPSFNFSTIPPPSPPPLLSLCDGTGTTVCYQTKLFTLHVQSDLNEIIKLTKLAKYSQAHLQNSQATS